MAVVAGLQRYVLRDFLRFRTLRARRKGSRRQNRGARDRDADWIGRQEVKISELDVLIGRTADEIRLAEKSMDNSRVDELGVQLKQLFEQRRDLQRRLQTERLFEEQERRAREILR